MIKGRESSDTPLHQIRNLSRLMEEGGLTAIDVAGPDCKFRSELTSITDYSTVNENFCRVLVCLRDLEVSIRASLSPHCQIYLLGLENIRRLSIDAFRSIGSNDLLALCSILHSFGLIYRLPCAVKFQYDPVDVVQIRMFGWGLHACKHISDPDPGRTPCRRLRLEQMFYAHSVHYSRLIAACTSSERPLDVGLIHRLNELLPVPIVT